MDEPVVRAREMWPPGTVVREDYVIERRLGQGGFGTIYLARHRFLQSLHVIKRLHEQYATDEIYVRKFIREGQAVRRLRGCPHIIEIEHMTQTADGHLLLVMEYLPDGDLETLIKTHGTLAVAEAVDLAVQIAKALEAAHAVGLIHRDIKPLNVLLSRRADGSLLAKVIDFGIAADHTSQHSTSRMAMGSLGYTSPEQWLNPGKNLDGRADLYSLGATLYRMLTGQTPITAENEMMWLANARTVPPPPSKWQPGVAPELDRLVLQLLAYQREDRPPNAAATIAALQEIGKPKPALPPKPDVDITQATRVPPRRAWLAVPVLAALVGWIGWRTWQPTDVTPQVLPTQAPEPCLDRAPQDRAYTRERLVAMVSDQTPVRAEYLIRTCGVRTPWSAQLEKELRAAGVDEGVIQAVKEKAPETPAPPKPRAPDGPIAGDVREHAKDGRRYVYIPPGNFRMGCSQGDSECDDDEKPPHDVRITKGFWMGQTEVTVAAYKRFAEAAKRSIPSGNDAFPINNVNWNDASAYCSWAGLRLPTEAEWEYAARAGSTAARYGELNEIAWHDGNSGNAVHPVGQKRANAFQLFDMLGNVWEWTAVW